MLNRPSDRPFSRPTAGRAAAWALAVATLLLPLSCTSGGKVQMRSIDDAAALTPSLPVVAYAARDPNTADIYLTSLTPDQLDPATPLADLEGHIVHIHMFVAPRAGKTPIDETACSVTIRHAVLARGAIGLYGGGGFLLPSGKAGDKTFGGSIRSATLRLIGSTAGFRDPLGAVEFDASVRAPHDERLARVIGQRIEDVALLVDRKPAAPAPTAAGK